MLFFRTTFVFLILILAGCSHQKLKDHFNKSRLGWSKDQIFKEFGSPNESYEDSDYMYYVYRVRQKYSAQKIRTWDVKYYFQGNKVQKVVQELVPTAEELEEIENLKSGESEKPYQFKEL